MAHAIETNPKKLHGEPCFAGTRVPVRALFDLLAKNRTIEEFLRQYPTVRQEQVLRVLDAASDNIGKPAA